MKNKIVKLFLSLLIFSTTALPTYATELNNQPKRIQDVSSFGSASLFNNLNNLDENVLDSYFFNYDAPYKNEYKFAEEKDPAIGTIAFANVQDFVYVRSEANTDSDALGKMHTNAACEILDSQKDWYQIKSGSIANGWVHKDYLYTGEEAEEIAKLTEKKYAKVNTTTLRIRQEADTESEIMGLVALDDDLIVINEDDEWVEVIIGNDKGWVSKEFVDIRTEYKQAESKEEEEARLAKEERDRKEAEKARKKAEEAEKARRAEEEAKKIKETQKANNETENNTTKEETKIEETTIEEVKKEETKKESITSSSSNGQAVVNYATQFIGNPYVYGGSSLTNGADCSGFIMSVYAHFGVSLPHSSTALRNVGYEVSLSEAKPGDIICYNGHAAIYCGNNTVVHASSEKTGIKYTSPADYRSVVCVRRIF